jgi:hypothetical protein
MELDYRQHLSTIGPIRPEAAASYVTGNSRAGIFFRMLSGAFRAPQGFCPLAEFSAPSMVLDISRKFSRLRSLAEGLR